MCCYYFRFSSVRVFVDEKSDEKTRAKFGKEWVRGWNDGSSKGGNQ